MGSVNKISALLIPIVLLCYLVYLFVDAVTYTNSGFKLTYIAHLRNLANNGKQFNGLILGGSNAFFGLSATTLRQGTSINFYNLSLAHEGWSDAGYNSFIDEAAEKYLLAETMSTVVYSSILPLRNNAIELYLSEKPENVWGGRSGTIKPNVAFATFFRRLGDPHYTSEQSALLPQLNGDLDFRTMKCNRRNVEAQFEISPVEAAIGFVKHKLEVLHKIFPKSKIVIVIPSEYYAGEELPAAWVKRLQNEFERVKLANEFLLIQPPIPSVEFLCTDRHHMNESGRMWRTDNLKQFLNSVVNVSST